jgi:hypothetical protein
LACKAVNPGYLNKRASKLCAPGHDIIMV